MHSTERIEIFYLQLLQLFPSTLLRHVGYHCSGAGKPDDPPAHQMPDYVEKYRERLAALFGTAENFASMYPVALRIRPTAIRGH